MTMILPNEGDWKHCYGPGADGVKLHYVRAGRGKPIVLMHGWPGFWYDWRRVIGPLSELGDVIVPDIRGFGLSDKPVGAPADLYGPSHMARDIAELLKHLDVGPALVVGHDVGSTVTQFLSRQAPDLVQRLVLFNPAHPGIGMRRFEPGVIPDFWYQHFHNLPWCEQMVVHDRDTLRLYLAHFYDHWVGRKQSVVSEEFEAIVDTYNQPGAFAASIAYYRARSASRVKDANLDPKDVLITKPVTIYWGELDPVMRSLWSDRLGEFFTAIETFKLLPDVGHFVPFEDPQSTIEAIRTQFDKLQ